MPLDPSLEPLFEAAARQYDIDPRLLRTVAMVESSGNPRIPDSPTGDRGLMQFQPPTAAEMGVRDPYDPAQAIPGAARYLAQGLAEGERLKVADPVQYALMYYNGGPRGPGNPQTHAYVNAAAHHYNALAGADAPANPVALAGMPAGADFAAGRPTAPPAAEPIPGGDQPWPFPDLPVRPAAPAGLTPPPQGVPRMPLSLPQILSQGLPSPNGPGFPMGGALPGADGLQQLLAGLRPEDVAGLVSRPDLTTPDRMAIDQRLGAMQQEAAPPPALPDAAAPMMMMSDAGPVPTGLAAGGGAVPAAPRQAPLALPADLDALRNVGMPAGAPAGPAGAPPAAGEQPIVGAAPAPSPAPTGDFSQLSDDELVQRVASGALAVAPLPRAASAAAPATPLPGAPAMPAPPPGAVPMDSVEGRMARIQYYQSHALPDLAGEEQKALDRIQTSGVVPYRLSNGAVGYFPIEGGPADPARLARQATATAGGEATGKAPYETVEAIVQGPNGPIKMQIPKDLWEQQMRAQPPPGAQPAAAPAAGGAAGPKPPPAEGSLTGAPITPGEATKTFYDQFGGLAKTADEARQGLYQTQLLRDKLHELGTSGSATEYLGRLDAYAAQLGVPESVRQGFRLPSGAGVEEADKLSQDLLGAVLKAQFPGRITNADIMAWKSTVPRVTNRIEANDFLIDRVLGPKFQRDIDRYGHVAGLPQQDQTLSSLSQQLNQWDQDPKNSYGAYAERATKAATERAAAAVPEGLPPGSKQIGTRGGHPVWQAPDGGRFMVQ